MEKQRTEAPSKRTGVYAVRHGRLLPALLTLFLLVCGCGIAVHADRSEIGGGPEQATAQAQARIRATIIAAATANPQLAAAGTPCDCESTGK